MRNERRVQTWRRSRSDRPVRRPKAFSAVRCREHDTASVSRYIALTLTTKTWYEETIPLGEEDFADGGLPMESFVVPWGVSSPQDANVETYLGRLRTSVVDEAVEVMFEYVFESDETG